MRKIVMVLVLCVVAMVGCASSEVSLSETEQGICTEGCHGMVGEVWQACVDIGCGGTGGGGAGVGGSGGGGGGQAAQTCTLIRYEPCGQSPGSNMTIAVTYCCYSTGASLSCREERGVCWPDPHYTPPAPPPTGPGGGGGSTNPPCHGSGCVVENGGPPTSNL